MALGRIVSNYNERNYSEITKSDLRNLLVGSKRRVEEYFIQGKGNKWLRLYNIKKPLCIALCQGAAMHYFDKKNGIKDFDVWFFYPFNKKHLPYRTIWNWNYKKPKFGTCLFDKKYCGRRVDVIVRSVNKFCKNDPLKTIITYLIEKQTSSAKELSKKAVVLLTPEKCFGKTIWYKGLCLEKETE